MLWFSSEKFIELRVSMQFSRFIGVLDKASISKVRILVKILPHLFVYAVGMVICRGASFNLFDNTKIREANHIGIVGVEMPPARLVFKESNQHVRFSECQVVKPLNDSLSLLHSSPSSYSEIPSSANNETQREAHRPKKYNSYGGLIGFNELVDEKTDSQLIWPEKQDCCCYRRSVSKLWHVENALDNCFPELAIHHAISTI